MPRRSLTNARSTLDALLPSISDHWAKQFERQYQNAVLSAQQFADTYVTQTTAGIEEERRELLEDLCELRDAFAALAADGVAGRLSAREYEQRHNELTRQHRQATAGVQEFERVTTLVEDVEEDPLSWVDNFQQRFPHAATEFEF